jgi:hypothetical protein
MIHELKCWPEQFEEVFTGRKRVEIRRNDRSFKPRDAILLREWNPKSGSYTGREIGAEIVAVHVPNAAPEAFGFPPCPGIVVMELHHEYWQPRRCLHREART